MPMQFHQKHAGQSLTPRHQLNMTPTSVSQQLGLAAPYRTQVRAMLWARYLLYQRSRKLVITTILFPLIMIAIAIGMSALIDNTAARNVPKPGTVVPAIPILAPVLPTQPATPKFLLVAGGSDDVATAQVQAVMNRYFAAIGQETGWIRVRSAKELGDIQLDLAGTAKRKASSTSSSATHDSWAPIGGFFLHDSRASTKAPFQNISLVINADTADGRSLGRVPPQLLTLLHSGLQAILPVNGPDPQLFVRAGQDRRTRQQGASEPPSGLAAQSLLESVFARYREQVAIGSRPQAPWMVGFQDSSLATFRVQNADQLDLSAMLVPPFVTYGLYFLVSFLAAQLVRERIDGQFDFLTVNTLSIRAYFDSFYLVSFVLLIIPCTAVFAALAVFVPWFRETTWIGLALTFIAFSASTVTSSGMFSPLFQSKSAASVVVGFAAAIIAFVPFFVLSLIVKTQVSLAVILAMTALVPSYGLQHVLTAAAEAYRAGRPMASVEGVMVPIIGIMLVQAVVGYAVTIQLAANPDAGSSLWLCRSRQGKSIQGRDVETAAGGRLPHPNQAIPLDPYLLSEKLRIQKNQQGEREDVVTMSGLCKDFVHRRVLDDLYMSVFKNESLAFLGPNGAGKSTAISILTGLLRPTHGNATICGKSVVPFDPAIKRTLGVCPQHDKVFPDLTVREHLEAFAAIKGLADVKVAVSQALKDMVLEPVQHTLSKNLSGGNRRRLSIAIACLGRPPVVILDGTQSFLTFLRQYRIDSLTIHVYVEPTTGVDVATRRTIWNSIRDLKRHSSVLLVTHAMDEADALCERIGIMINGSLVCLGTPQCLKSLYGAAYKISLRFYTVDAVAPAVSALDAQFPRGSVKILSQAGPILRCKSTWPSFLLHTTRPARI
ncbi:hypothetical protein BCR44DRAFT_1124534 [Catenaria anguillulae PL171]|uniref:ABC transporter domain-containing protein n=1 Tax=Catenaria anguillulae PL171 TaxID=765915 RepID=A0A1Y2HKN6_9FUNG|nr:hypothetical protein BCR44DRAFT_1124534 [Catenaria anguillulae PL171]